ncbi:MAG: hypothetical protein MZU95_17685 [Desulfomicrobium escambiense]|nr:hypothetical protein [Desulfomicrobium escambiense]
MRRKHTRSSTGPSTSGVNYFESARAYSGSEIILRPLPQGAEEGHLSHEQVPQPRQGSALLHLEETLGNMKTDHLDLWQVHDVRTEEDIEEIFGPGGAIEAL